MQTGQSLKRLRQIGVFQSFQAYGQGLKLDRRCLAYDLRPAGRTVGSLGCEGLGVFKLLPKMSK